MTDVEVRGDRTGPAYDFGDRVALVTGAGSGMGLARATAGLTAEGYEAEAIGRLGRADEIAAAVSWLCSPGASFVLGVALPVDGGDTAQ